MLHISHFITENVNERFRVVDLAMRSVINCVFCVKTKRKNTESGPLQPSGGLI